MRKGAFGEGREGRVGGRVEGLEVVYAEGVGQDGVQVEAEGAQDEGLGGVEYGALGEVDAFVVSRWVGWNVRDGLWVEDRWVEGEEVAVNV